MKKIAIVLNSSWYAYNFRYDLGLELQKKGYKVTFIAPYDIYSDRLKERFDFFDILFNSKSMNPFQDLKAFIHLYKIYKKIRPSIILHYTIKPNIYGTIAANILGIKTINNIAGLGTLFIKKNFVTFIVKKMYKVSQRNASKIFFQNNDDMSMFIDERIVCADKVELLPGSGVNVEKFKPVPLNESKTFKFLVVSRMLWAKGISDYVEAASLLRKKFSNVQFQLLGFLDVDSPTAISKKQMDLWVASGNVIYLGSTDRVNDFIAKADCIVLPSYYREGVPRSLLESASMGKPIITTNNIGCKDVVDDGVNGFLCNIKDPIDLSEKMERMINIPVAERLKMGQAGREKIINQFDERIVINKYLLAISKLLTSV